MQPMPQSICAIVCIYVCFRPTQRLLPGVYHLGRSLIHGNAGLLALSAWTSRSTEGQMEGLSHASSRWWYDLRSGHQLSHVHVPRRSESRSTEDSETFGGQSGPQPDLLWTESER